MVYKNVSDLELTVPNAGVWKPGEEKESPIKIENPNFKEVTASQAQNVSQQSEIKEEKK